MKRFFVIFVLLSVSIFSFANCDFFQIANDCNGESTTVIARNDVVSLDIHANWNQGNISYKCQSGPEKLDMLVYTNDPNRLYTEIAYKSRSARMYYDFILGQMTIEDLNAFSSLIASIPSSFIANIQFLVDDLPEYNENTQLLRQLADALLNPNAAHPMDLVDYIAYLSCIGGRMAGGESYWEAEDICYQKYISKTWQ